MKDRGGDGADESEMMASKLPPDQRPDERGHALEEDINLEASEKVEP